MSLVKWNPESSLFPLSADWMDELFNDRFFEGYKPMVKGVSLPAVNVREDEKAYHLEVAAPGFEKEDFKLALENGYLIISGENKAEKEEKGAKFNRREFKFNSFTRSFALPDNVLDDKVTANYEKGILKIEVPKSKKEMKGAVKQIKVS